MATKVISMGQLVVVGQTLVLLGRNETDGMGRRPCKRRPTCSIRIFRLYPGLDRPLTAPLGIREPSPGPRTRNLIMPPQPVGGTATAPIGLSIRFLPRKVPSQETSGPRDCPLLGCTRAIKHRPPDTEMGAMARGHHTSRPCKHRACTSSNNARARVRVLSMTLSIPQATSTALATVAVLRLAQREATLFNVPPQAPSRSLGGCPSRYRQQLTLLEEEDQTCATPHGSRR